FAHKTLQRDEEYSCGSHPSNSFVRPSVKKFSKSLDGTGEPAKANAEADSEMVWNIPVITWRQKETPVQGGLAECARITSINEQRKSGHATAGADPCNGVGMRGNQTV